MLDSALLEDELTLGWCIQQASESTWPAQHGREAETAVTEEAEALAGTTPETGHI